MANIEYIKNAVSELLGNNSVGHDDKHVFRVYDYAMSFCDEIPNANRDLVALAALLHDCDDYKLFGKEAERLLPNARRILADSGFPNDICEKCLEIIKTIGYSKRLMGIKPNCIEGEIVSDADMCDASGLVGLIRAIEYHSDDIQEPFFDPDFLPTKEVDVERYRQRVYTPTVNHFFDKLLRLRDICLTEPGKRCINKKHQTIVNFLKTYFDEINAPQKWKDLLAKYE